MNHQTVLKQAWHMLWSYRLLWILGFALALTTCSWQGASNFAGRYDDGQRLTIKSERFNLIIPGFEGTIDLTPDQGPKIILPYDDGQSVVITHEDGWSVDMPPKLERDLRDLTAWLNGDLPPEMADLVVGSIAIIAAVIIAVVLLASVVRYVADVALIRAVNDQAETGQRASLGRLLGMGFSRSAWRFFLIDLIVRLPLLVLFAALLLLSLTPLSLWATGDVEASLLGISATGLLVSGLMLLAVAINAVLSVMIAFFRRSCALEEVGVLAAISRGLNLLVHNIKDVAVMTAVVILVTIAWAILLIPAALLLIPIVLAFVLLGGLAFVVVFLPVAGLASLALGEVLALVLAASVALVVFIPIVGAPIFFANGLLHVYISSTWTLTFRELRAAEGAVSKATPKVALTGI